MNYVLEDKNEGERLKTQASFKNYNVDEELRAFEFKSTDVILDAGCGAGAITRYLVNNVPYNKIYGCDFSESRIIDLKHEYKDNTHLEFKVEDLKSLSFASESFDKIVCRFVLQHIPEAQKVITEFYRILKKGGELIIIEADGFIFDLFTKNQKLKTLQEKIKSALPVNLYMGRECPSLLTASQFHHIDWNLIPMPFKGLELINEHKMMSERFIFMKNSLISILGSESEYKEFCKLYLEEMLNPGAVLFSNKFIVCGRKTSSCET